MTNNIKISVLIPTYEMHGKGVEFLNFSLDKIQTRNYFAGNILMHPAYQYLGDYKEYPMLCTIKIK